MEWNHLYTAGGLEDQNPMLLYYFDIMHREKSKAEKERQDKQQKEMEAKQKQSSRPVAGRRRR